MTHSEPPPAAPAGESVILPPSCDVAILGAGPAGLATALALARLAPHRSMVLIDTGQRPRPSSLEVLDDSARSALDALDLGSAFAELAPEKARGALAAWVGDQLGPAPAELFPRAPGWRVGRREFEAFLRAAAVERGLLLATATHLVDVVRAAPGFRLELDSGARRQSMEARLLVDASGRQAVLARRLGGRKVRFDRLVGAFVSLDAAAEAFADADALIEAHPEGVWYAVPRKTGAAGGITVAFMTDADVARRLAIGDAAAWRRLFAPSACRRWLGDAALDAALDAAPPVVRALDAHGLDLHSLDVNSLDVNSLDVHSLDVHSLDVHSLERPGGGFLAVGDAALTADPLTSSGLARALSSGVLAGRALTDALVGRGASLKRYESRLESELDELLERRRRLYALAGRFADATFWRRRLECLGIGPDHLLTFADSPANRAQVEGFGMHLPVAQLLLLCELCAAPRLTQAVVRAFRESVDGPISERRVMLALSELVERGFISAE